MCFDAKPSGDRLLRRRGRTMAVAASLALLTGGFLALAGCGKKGDPLPPLRNIPQRTDDLKIRQQGRLILLDMAYPATTVSGMALGAIDAVELHELVGPTVEGTASPVEERQFEAEAEVLLTLRGSELATAVTGDRIQIRVPLAAELPAEPMAHYFAVRTLKADETSALSNGVTLVPIEPPPPPRDLRLTPRAAGVELAWEIGDESAAGFDVFRRQAEEHGYGEPIQSLPAETRQHLDTTARYGKRYIYTVRTVANREPLIESAAAGESEIGFEDRFAPPLPESFVALGERARVRLRWDPSAAGDVGGYILHRREPGRDFHRITDAPISQVEYIDRGLVSGYEYAYRIQVVDQVGNQSELSEPVSTTVR
ncbi:MAG: fibronectin type III domain-containing protein [bacterium]|nr:fibronectin type III domain-containing protein [bacterium]